MMTALAELRTFFFFSISILDFTANRSPGKIQDGSEKDDQDFGEPKLITLSLTKNRGQIKVLERFEVIDKQKHEDREGTHQ